MLHEWQHKEQKVKKPTKKRNHRQTGALRFSDPDVMIFAGEKELSPGALEQHSLSGWAGPLFGRTKVEVRADWEKVVNQIRYLLDEVSAATKDYSLSEITFQLGFSAEGQIVFAAKSGITTTISAKFTRK
jgi:hypothetical protein